MRSGRLLSGGRYPSYGDLVAKPVVKRAKAPAKLAARIKFWRYRFADGGVQVRIIGLRLLSESNLREHWATKHKRKTAQQTIVGHALAGLKLAEQFGEGPIEVRLVRIGPRRMDPDNAAGACKHVQDQVARALGRDDGDTLIVWEYRQQRIDARTYGLVVEISKPIVITKAMVTP